MDLLSQSAQGDLLTNVRLFSFLAPQNGLGEATKLLKFAIKHHRVRGVHVTPTVFVNSIEAPDISSSWNADKWMEKLKAISEN